MRIVFMGTPRFSIPSLAVLLEAGFEIPAVVTVPDKPKGRGRQLGMSPLKEFALSREIPVLQPELLTNPEFLTQLSELRSDLFIVVAFRILPKVVYAIPPKGAFNLHASLLPKYRGAAPINWAIINGERETGVTTFFLEEKVDAGSMILQKKTSIGKDETAGELAERLAQIGAEGVLESVRLIASGSLRTNAQDSSLASPAPKIQKEDCAIPWSKEAAAVHNFIRGLSPIPCAWTTFHDHTLRVFRSSVPDRSAAGVVLGGRPGEAILVDKEKLFVRTGEDGLVSIMEIQQEGKKRMGIGEFLRGFKLKAGDLLGS